MGDLVLSPAMLTAVSSLSSIQEQMAELQKRLATGKRVNSPIDDPAAYFTAQNLSARADAINSLAAGLQGAQSTVDAASNGLKSIQSLLSTAQGIAYQALEAAGSVAPTVTGTRSALTTSTTIASTSGTATKFKAGDTVTVSDGTTTATYTAANNDTVQTFLDAINDTSGLKVVASLNASGQIELTATSNVSITIGGTVSGANGGTLTSITGLTAGTAAPGANSTLRQSLALQYDSLLTQINQMASDAGFDGTNLLAGDTLTAALNETGTSKLTVSGGNVNSTGLGLSVSSDSWQLDSDINSALTQINTAIATVQATSASLGSSSGILQARTEFNKSMADTLTSGADTLTASDINADSAMLLALQTRQQLTTTTLSMASGAYANALQLFS
jgi:flagellin-like hook-associated protein FlgL